MVCLKMFPFNNRFCKAFYNSKYIFLQKFGVFTMQCGIFSQKETIFFAKALTIRTFQGVKQECLFENFTNFLHSPTYKPRERRFFNPQRKLLQSAPTIPKTFERENIDVLKKFSTYQRKNGVQSGIFLNKFLSIREKERISHPVFMKVLSKDSTYQRKKRVYLNCFAENFCKKLPLQI